MVGITRWSVSGCECKRYEQVLLLRGPRFTKLCKNCGFSKVIRAAISWTLKEWPFGCSRCQLMLCSIKAANLSGRTILGSTSWLPGKFAGWMLVTPRLLESASWSGLYEPMNSLPPQRNVCLNRSLCCGAWREMRSCIFSLRWTNLSATAKF